MSPDYNPSASKLVSALEILRAYAEAYAEASFGLAVAAQKCSSDPAVIADAELVAFIQFQLRKLLDHSERLPVTTVKIRKVLLLLENAPRLGKLISSSIIGSNIAEIQDRLVDELSTMLFFQIPTEKHRFFSEPISGWEEIIDRWPNVRTDVEEMGRCFALSRYAASVFHSVQAIESGLLQLGDFLGVKDPQSGWTAVSKELDKIVITKHENLSEFHKINFQFLEQVQGVTKALKNAWRNKISHSQGRLSLLTSEFTPDVAEEIMIASRAYMRRLATEMPGQK